MLKVAEEAYRSDTGRQRNANEDSFFARSPVFAVADGMGGAQAGEVASQIAAEAFETGTESGESPERYLERIVRVANERIHRLAMRDSDRSGMGTTLTAAVLRDDEISLAHVGDSRAYLLRDGELRRLTSDHSLVEEMRRRGQLTERQAEEHPQRSIITRALGPEPEVDVDTMTYPGQPGDVIVLCSDGLTTMVSEAKIEKILNNAKDLDAAVKRLVKEANSEGGRDNITVLAFRLAAAGEPAAVGAEPAPADPATEDATLIGPTATDAGLDAEAMRAASPRREHTSALNKPRRSAGRRIARLVIALGIIALVVGGAIYGARQVYFLGTDDGGRVALYRGLPYELPFGVNLYSEQYSAPVQVDSLTVARQRSVTAHELRSHDDAVSLIDDIQRAAPAPNGTPNRRGGGNATNPGAKGGGGKGGGGKGKSGRGKKSTGGGGKGKSGGGKKSTGGGKSKSSGGNGGGGSKGG